MTGVNIGLVRRGYSPTGGAEAYLRRFAAALAEAGHEPVLFATRDWPEGDWAHASRHVVPGQTPMQFAAMLDRLLPRAGCDVVFSMERVFGCDCYRAGDGVHRAWLERRARHEPWVETWFRKLRATHRELLALETRLFKGGGARRVIANSQMVKEEIVSGFGYPGDRVDVIPNGVPPVPAPDECEVLRARAREELGLERDRTVVLFAGSGWERKGLAFAVHAMNLVRTGDPLMLVAGRGDPKDCPPSRRVRLLGPVADMRPIYAASDIFVLPTLYDPFSNACLEALSFGLPVITTAENGFSGLIVGGRDGEIVDDPADTKEIARGIEMWVDPDRRMAERSRLRGLAAPYTVEANLRATIGVLETLRKGADGR